MAMKDLNAPEGYITDVDGIRVGHFTDRRRPTGCTVVLCEEGAVTSVEVRGSAPGTRETDLLDPVHSMESAHAVLLAGGSAFGLDAASGVVRYLEEKGIGFPTPFARVPIVPAAILYDLRLGDPQIRPDADSGYRACQAASNGKVEEGSVGAGAGATVGKITGRPMKGGLGTSSIRLPGGIVIGALAAVNCMGNVIDPATGKTIAGARTVDGWSFVDLLAWYRAGNFPPAMRGENTTIGVVATNARLTKTQMKKIAEMAHDGLARAINPVHTPHDGDTIFAMATGSSNVTGDLGCIGALAAEAMTEAVLRGVMRATAVPGYPAYADIRE
jgi:L-aminopeptidase/D-esterase-like protein